MSAFTFNKQEKLKSRKLIQQLFAEGKAVNAVPLRIIYINPSIEMDVAVKAGVTVSSRNFKKAVDRNRIKRLLREAYRLNKAALLQHVSATGQQLALFIVYTDRVLPDFAIVNEKMPVILNKLIKATSEAASKNA